MRDCDGCTAVHRLWLTSDCLIFFLAMADEHVPCRRCVLEEQDAGAAELLDSDLMITRSERRWRRGIAGTLAAAGISATFVAQASMGVGSVFMTSALVAETAVGANF